MLIFNFHHTTDWILCPLLRVTWQSQSRENSQLSKQVKTKRKVTDDYGQIYQRE